MWLLAVFETTLGLSGRKTLRRGIVLRADLKGGQAAIGGIQGVPTANRLTNQSREEGSVITAKDKDYGVIFEGY